jgi:hypothetical protein
VMKAPAVDITGSDNHWSTQETMQRWVAKVLLPHSERMIEAHSLDSDTHMTTASSKASPTGQGCYRNRCSNSEWQGDRHR